MEDGGQRRRRERIVENVVERMKMMRRTRRVLKASPYSHEVKLTDSTTTFVLKLFLYKCLFCDIAE